jgi:drug/metabolite transporter (DMT)-like permease
MKKASELSPATKGLLYVLAGAVTISAAPLFVKLVDAGPNMIASYRMFWGSFTLLAIALYRGEKIIPGKAMLITMIWSAAFFSLDLIFWHQSILYVGPGLATILTNFQVFFLAIYGAFFLKERMGWRMKLSMPLVLVGLWLVLDIRITEFNMDMGIGLATGILSALFYAGFVLTLRYSQTTVGMLSPTANIGVISFISIFFTGFAGIVSGEDLVVHGLQNNLLLIASGVGVQALGWLLLSKGLPLMTATRAGLLMMLQPTLSFAWDILLFGRPTSVTGFLGAAGALLAISMGVSDRAASQAKDAAKTETEDSEEPHAPVK